MRGDFSSWNKEKSLNFRGTLHQQGRVLLDRDWNAQTEIFNDWQEIAARDTIGADVAAVPADAAESFKVTKAEISGKEVVLSVKPGRVWADGLLVELNEKDLPAKGFKADYLAPPIQNPKAETPQMPPNTPLRDAVILETWLEELNAFQSPDLLIEPALGSVDTTERVQTAFRFRLFRMKDGDSCTSIADSLKDKFVAKGKLRATLQQKIPPGDKDCPVVEGGGYTGFEHQLYRIEIAESNPGEAYFKWSQFNGGLVGRGFFDSVNFKLDIKANRNAIINSGLTDFYLEALEFDAELNYWKVIYGAPVSLDSNNMLSLPAGAQIGTIPSPKTKPYFFRLWNGIEKISKFKVENKLQDGICLQFDTDAADKYTPGDYWTFPVRAGEIKNNEVLFESKAPEGIYYHRVPLAELTWRDDTLTETDVELEDCRRIFQPLTKLKGCCSYRVGDGIASHGDFTSINQAISALPKEGGEICVLPGIYRENVVLKTPHNLNITIKGCGSRSRIEAPKKDPAIYVAGGSGIKIESLAIQADRESAGILLEGDEFSASGNAAPKFGLLQNITLQNLAISAAERSAIEMHVGQFVSITNCRITIDDVPTDWSAVYLAGDDLLFENNEIRVTNRKDTASTGAATEDAQRFTPSQNAAGGLHLSGGCERVRVVNNLIIGGVGNGINLGSVDVETDRNVIVLHLPWNYYPSGGKDDKCNPKPGYLDTVIIDERTRYIAGAPLRDILIEGNRIFATGANGIGVDAYFVIEQPDPKDPRQETNGEFIIVENLRVFDNRIEFCLNRPLKAAPGELNSWMGHGGISLAAVNELIVRDNLITDNGANYLEAVCGIFVLIGEGIEISRNRIVNNGRLTAEKATEGSVKQGARGGVFILFALPGMTVGFASNGNQPGGNFGGNLGGPIIPPIALFPDGVPALKLHENVIGVTMGRTLTIIAMGNLSIVGNQFLSQNAIPGRNIFNLLSSNILIFNLSKSFSLKPTTNFRKMGAEINLLNLNRDSKPDVEAYQQQKPPEPNNPPPGTVIDQEQPDKEAVVRRSFVVHGLGGGTLFSNNQVRTLNAGRDEVFNELCAVMIISLADIGFHNNQCSLTALRRNHLVQALVIGMTVRFTDNYLEEILRSVVFSGVTLGYLNTTTDNQSTNCLLGTGALYLDRYNISLFDAEEFSGSFDRSRCSELGTVLNSFIAKRGGKATNLKDATPEDLKGGRNK